MSVITAFNEAEGLTNISDALDLQISTLAGITITGVARGGFLIRSAGNQCTHSLPSTQTTGWLHFICRGRTSGAGSGATEFLSMRDEAGAPIFGLGNVSAGVSVHPVLAGVLNSSVTLASAGVNTYDINYNIANTGGFIRCFVNGALVYEFSGDTMPGTTGVATLRFTGGATGSTSTTLDVHFGQVLLSSNTTIGSLVHTLPLTAFGAVNDWTGALTTVNGHALNDTTFLSEDAVNGTVLFDKGVMSAILAGNQITGVGMTHRSLFNTGSAVTRTQPAARVSSVNHFGTSQLLTNGLRNYTQMFALNPATSAPWTVAEVNAAQIGLRAVA